MSDELNIRDRVVRTVKVPASSLKPSPWNWRIHPDGQKRALRGVLREIGFAGAEVARELEDGTLELIDGHARAEEMGDRPVTVLVTDLTEDEARKLVAVYDPIGELAEMNKSLLGELLETVSAEDPDMQATLDDLMRRVTEPDSIPLPNTPPTPPDEFGKFDETIEVEHTCPKCGYQFSGGKVNKKRGGFVPPPGDE